MQRRLLAFGVLGLGALGLAGCGRETIFVPAGQPAGNLLGNADFPMKLVGNGPRYIGVRSAMIDGLESGVRLVSTTDYHLTGLKFRNIAGPAVDVRAAGNSYHHAGFLSQIAVAHSYCGFRFSDKAEYETVSDCNAAYCAFGFDIGSGNNSFSNCKVVNCSVGVRISGGSNNGHGFWNGLMSNHCETNLLCEDVTNGEHFAGSCFIGGVADHQGKIAIVKSQGISINGGQISDVDLHVDGRSQALLTGIVFGGTVNVTVLPGGNLLASANMVLPGTKLKLNGAPWSGKWPVAN